MFPCRSRDRVRRTHSSDDKRHIKYDSGSISIIKINIHISFAFGKFNGTPALVKWDGVDFFSIFFSSFGLMPWLLSLRALNTVVNNKVAQTNKVHKFKLCERIILRSNGIWMREGNVAWKQERKETKNNDDMSFYLCIRSLIETFVTCRCVAACAPKLYARQ